MPMTISFKDGREYDFDALIESGAFNVGPGGHCDECGREYGFACIGPRKYGDSWLCTDCKTWHFKDDHGLRDDDMGD